VARNNGDVFTAGIRVIKKSETEALEISGEPVAVLHFVRQDDDSTIVPVYEVEALQTPAGPLAGVKIAIPSTEVDFAAVKAALALADSAIDFNGQKLTGLADPDDPQDAATKAYAQTVASTRVASVAGSAPIVSSGGVTPTISINAASGAAAGSMSAAHYAKLEGIEASADVTDFANVSAALAAATGTIDMGGQQLANLDHPDDPNDAATMLYVDNAITTAVAALSIYFPLHWSFSSGVTGSNPAVIHGITPSPRMLDSTNTTTVSRQPVPVNCQLMGFVLAANQGGSPTNATLTFTVYKNNVATTDTFELNNNTTGNVLISTITGGGAFTTTYTAGTDDIGLKVNVKTGSNVAIAASNWCFAAKMKAV
jgi:hypothetical protein